MITPSPKWMITPGPKWMITPGPKMMITPGPKMMTPPGPKMMITPGPKMTGNGSGTLSEPLFLGHFEVAQEPTELSGKNGYWGRVIEVSSCASRSTLFKKSPHPQKALKRNRFDLIC